ncbi:Serine-tRNA synthetase, type1, N-terminal [Ceraceosorus bombacis]|uniref:Serine-tRNA synthetase, type1, N-terminal n=1 Tax=Ceraceosorus bombacis TaxID=401625 RepID=A0A0P1BR53_9BASI|nr:Serine-tRNA synthetase, type1, N-terminal [Ceraceosorus bombacis]
MKFQLSTVLVLGAILFASGVAADNIGVSGSGASYTAGCSAAYPTVTVTVLQDALGKLTTILPTLPAIQTPSVPSVPTIPAGITKALSPDAAKRAAGAVVDNLTAASNQASTVSKALQGTLTSGLSSGAKNVASQIDAASAKLKEGQTALEKLAGTVEGQVNRDAITAAYQKFADQTQAQLTSLVAKRALLDAYAAQIRAALLKYQAQAQSYAKALQSRVPTAKNLPKASANLDGGFTFTLGKF